MTTMDLSCTETASFSEPEPDIHVEGIRSIPDPALVNDHRVFANILDRVCDHPCIPDYFSTTQTYIKPHMRKIVVSWMLDVTEEQSCHPEVFALAVSYLDRFLSAVRIQKGQFQLLACVCIFLASKFNESSPLTAEKLVVYSDFSITTNEILQWELLVLQTLKWDLSAVTPYCIMDQLFRRVPIENFDMAKARHFAEALMSMASTEFSLQVNTAPSLIAVSCIAASLSRLREQTNQSEYIRTILGRLCNATGVTIREIIQYTNKLDDVIDDSVPDSIQPPAPKMAKQNNGSAYSCNVTISPTTMMSNSFSSCNINTASSTPTDLMEVSTTCVC